MLGATPRDFLQNLDALHDHLGTLYPGMRAPSFRCTETDGQLVLHYYSERPGLEHIVIGIVKAVASKLHGVDVEIKIIRRKGDPIEVPASNPEEKLKSPPPPVVVPKPVPIITSADPAVPELANLGLCKRILMSKTYGESCISNRLNSTLNPSMSCARRTVVLTCSFFSLYLLLSYPPLTPSDRFSNLPKLDNACTPRRPTYVLQWQ